MKIRFLGFFREHPDGNPEDPSLHEYVFQGDPGLRSRVVDYLDSASMLSVSTSTTFDVLSDSKIETGRSATRTDGVWMWPADLSYYVWNYNIRLPDEFLERAAGFDWVPPVVTDERIGAIVEEITMDEED